MTGVIINNQVLFDEGRRTLLALTEGGYEQHLTTAVGKLLSVLVAHKGIAVRKNILIDEIWNRQGLVVTENSLHQAVTSLRKALKESGIEENLIITSPRYGYAFQGETSSAPEEPKYTGNASCLISQVIPSPKRQSTTRSIFRLRVGFKEITILSIALWSSMFVLYFKSINGYAQLHILRTIEYYDTGVSLKGMVIFANSRLNNSPEFIQNRITTIAHNPIINNDYLDKLGVRYIYINGSNSESNYGYFLCDKPVENEESRCISTIIIEARS